MSKFTVVKQKVYIVEADSDDEANNIVTHEVATGSSPTPEISFFAAEYTKVYTYGVGDAVVSLAMEYDPEKVECRRVSLYEEMKEW
jgi:hypothetical protein